MTFIPEKYSGNRPAFRGQYEDPSGDPHRPCPSDRGRPGPLAAILPRRARVPSHHAILYPDRKTLAAALRRLLEARVPLEGASDHGVSEAIYLRDPDGNGVELYRDRPEPDWPRGPDGTLAMHTKPLDLEKLLADEE